MMMDKHLHSHEIERLLEKNSRAMVEVIHTIEFLKDKKFFEDSESQAKSRLKKLIRGIERRLRMLVGWSDMQSNEKRRSVYYGEIYRALHMRPPTGSHRSRKHSPYGELIKPGHEYTRTPAGQQSYSSAPKQMQASLAVARQPQYNQYYQPQRVAAPPAPVVPKFQPPPAVRQPPPSPQGAFTPDDFPPRRAGTSYPGVSYAKGKFNAQISWGGASYYMGRFDDELEAARAVQAGLIQAQRTGTITCRRYNGQDVTTAVPRNGAPSPYWFKDLPVPGQSISTHRPQMGYAPAPQMQDYRLQQMPQYHVSSSEQQQDQVQAGSTEWWVEFTRRAQEAGQLAAQELQDTLGQDAGPAGAVPDMG